MYSTIASAALLGLSGMAAAAPYNYGSSSSTVSSAASMSTGSSYGSSSNSSDFKFPLSNGFPNITDPSSELTDLEQQAHGTLPQKQDGTPPPPPPMPHPDSLVSLGFIAFNELFEVAFFTELVQNITDKVPGYQYSDIPNRDQVLAALKVVVAQEELHELNANGAFTHFTGNTITPCKYVFPVSNFTEAIGLASTFTDVVLSTLPDIQTIFAENGDNGLIRGVGSVIGQEGEQDGFYRNILGKVPSALPFLTAGARDFAFNAINQNFVVPGSCDASIDLLTKPEQGTGLQFFDILKAETDPSLITSDEDTTLDFSFSTTTSAVHAQSFVVETSGTQYLTYINQQNVPFSFPLGPLKAGHDKTTFSATFPGKTNEMNGLTFAAITNGKDFASADEVAAATVFGPALIEVN